MLHTSSSCEVFFISVEYNDAISEFNVPITKKIITVIILLRIANANKNVKIARKILQLIYKRLTEILSIMNDIINGVTNIQGIVSNINVRESNSDECVNEKTTIGNATL